MMPLFTHLKRHHAAKFDMATTISMQAGVQLMITVTDAATSELVDTISETITGTPGDPLSSFMVAVGTRALVLLTYAFRVTCDMTFFGPECNTVCIGRNESSGHFSCNPEDGSIVCLAGYRNETLNCATVEGCCKCDYQL